MTLKLRGPVDNISWLRSNSIDNWSLSYEDILEFWYSKLLPLCPGVVYDVGAHQGRHTVVFESLGRHVIAFEPNPTVREMLITNLGPQTTVEVRSEALCNRSGSGHFMVNRHAPEESGIQRRIYNDEDNADVVEIQVVYARIDDLHRDETVAFVKIDTEGGELDILRGAESMIAKCRPIISVEYGFPSYSKYGHEQRDLLDLSSALDYKIYDIFGFPIEPRDYPNVVDQFGWDYLLIPSEHHYIAGMFAPLRIALAREIEHFRRT